MVDFARNNYNRHTIACLPVRATCVMCLVWIERLICAILKSHCSVICNIMLYWTMLWYWYTVCRTHNKARCIQIAILHFSMQIIIWFRRKPCQNPLAHSAVLLGLGHGAVGYVEQWITHSSPMWCLCWVQIDPTHKPHSAPVSYPTMHHFVTEMCTHVHISVTKWCIVGYGTGVLWDLCYRSVTWTFVTMVLCGIVCEIRSLLTHWLLGNFNSILEKWLWSWF